MHRLARHVLVVVAVFTLVVAGLLAARSQQARTDAPGPPPSQADLTIREIRLDEETPGGARWQVVAEQAAVFDAQGRTTLTGVRVSVQEPQRSWTIVGEEGDLYREGRRLEVRGGVVVTSSDGLRLETSVLRWDDGRRRLWTDAPVRLTRPGLVVEGRALDVRTTDQATTVRGGVRATFTVGGRG